jgi:hypothetical protein
MPGPESTPHSRRSPRDAERPARARPRGGRRAGSRCVGLGLAEEFRRRRQSFVGHAVDLVVEPAIPFGRDSAGIVGAVVGDEAAASLLRGIIEIAERIAADLAAVAAQVQQGGQRRAVPPGEELLEQAHGRAD